MIQTATKSIVHEVFIAQKCIKFYKTSTNKNKGDKVNMINKKIFYSKNKIS